LSTLDAELVGLPASEAAAGGEAADGAGALLVTSAAGAADGVTVKMPNGSIDNRDLLATSKGLKTRD
jgi:hypothetical protein